MRQLHAALPYQVTQQHRRTAGMAEHMCLTSPTLHIPMRPQALLHLVVIVTDLAVWLLTSVVLEQVHAVNFPLHGGYQVLLLGRATAGCVTAVPRAQDAVAAPGSCRPKSCGCGVESYLMGAGDRM